MNDTARDDPDHRYVTDWFWPIDRLAQAVGISAGDLADLIDAGCGPGVIYAFSDRHGWWSALDGHLDGYAGPPPEEAERWFAPAAVWGFRRAVLARRRGVSPRDAARQNQAAFVEDFLSALRHFPEARHGFADCFDRTGSIMDTVARAQAAQEWTAWIKGGYAVCLRIFTGETCVRKESLGAWLKAHIADPEGTPMTAGQALSMCENLAQLMLPFAPWQRPGCTPGLTIDRLVSDLRLGAELPFRR
jgi:hypothetical protein